MGRGSHIPYISPLFSHTPTHFPTSPLTPLFTPPQHFSTPTPTFPHSFHIPLILDPTLQTIQNSPITPPSILLQNLYKPLFFPILLPRRTTSVALSFTPHQNFSLFSVIVKLFQQSSALETPCKFHTKKIKNKNKKWQHRV